MRSIDTIVAEGRVAPAKAPARPRAPRANLDDLVDEVLDELEVVRLLNRHRKDERVLEALRKAQSLLADFEVEVIRRRSAAVARGRTQR